MFFSIIHILIGPLKKTEKRRTHRQYFNLETSVSTGQCTNGRRLGSCPLFPAFLSLFETFLDQILRSLIENRKQVLPKSCYSRCVSVLYVFYGTSLSVFVSTEHLCPSSLFLRNIFVLRNLRVHLRRGVQGSHMSSFIRGTA